jgi:hypothetical protein
MNRTRILRPVPIALTALIAFFAAVGALAVSNATADAHRSSSHADHMTMPMGVTNKHALSKKALVLHDGMRKLWEDHITWTRLAIISLEGGTPDTDATVARLLKNQTDIGNAVKPFYGKAAGNQLTQLLREHILIAADLIAAAAADDALISVLRRLDDFAARAASRPGPTSSPSTRPR